MIYQLREEYGLKLFQNASKAGGLYRNNPPSLYDVLTSIKEDKVSLKLFAKIYYPGCCSDLGCFYPIRKKPAGLLTGPKPC